jgi:hypothetical protein
VTAALALLDRAKVAGLTLAAGADGRLLVHPRAKLDPLLRAELIAHKDEVLALLAVPLRPEAPVPSPEDLLSLALPRFAETTHCLALRVSWCGELLWFVPTETDAAALGAEGVSRGRVWTARELLDLLAVPGITRDQARTVAVAKLEFAGEVVAVREIQPSAGRP